MSLSPAKILLLDDMLVLVTHLLLLLDLCLVKIIYLFLVVCLMSLFVTY
jgi:hypothetical protein